MSNLFGAKLLFQYHVRQAKKAYRRRVCEERIILIRARGPRQALKAAKAYGAASTFEEFRHGRRIAFQFIGVSELIDSFGTDLDEDPIEVWWEFRELVRPMERKRQLLKREEELRVFNIGVRRRGAMSIYGAPRK